ncbi:chromate transporter, chromate ion transporter family [Methylophilaceae bacterium 11]|nr:chromate transporter, chromate ion transporter family [Methylophilaceae bacterium 11]
MDVNHNTHINTQAPRSISITQAMLYWLKLGFISFGGPAGQIAIMHHDLVENKRWISEKRFLHALNYCMVLPGPEAQQLATYIGWLMHRTWGGIIAGTLFFLPSFFILVILAWVYMAYGAVPAVAGALYGIKPAVVAIVLFAAYRIGVRTLKNTTTWTIATLAFLAIFALKLPFPLIVLAAGLIGYLGGHLYPTHFKIGGGHGATQHTYGPALIDDDTPTPSHAFFTWRKVWKITLIGIGIWLSAMLLLISNYGWQGAFTQMGWFFTKAALLTFGGAYAVLPYVYQGAVEHYQWLSPTQMIDALALGETTPGPLIMVVTFVGFVGGWVSQVFGADALLSSALIAATVVTFFTFLPSFIFILLGGPFIETTHGNLKFTAPLSAITAAVVGVILNLALFFAYHVFWSPGNSATLDWFSVALTAMAAFVIFRYKANVIAVILACGFLGMLWHLFY